MARFTTDSPHINRNGAPTLQARVEAWFSENPGGNISQCAKALNVSRPTARKWMPKELKQEKLQAEKSRLQEKLPPEPTKQEQVLDVIKEPGKIQKIWRILKK